ncbi:heme peroxidase [Mycena rebaudengoi]|nr:heme peroxidase [Mycena rebaudengoi]
MELTSLVLLSCLAPLVKGYVWPSPQLDALERLRWDQSLFNHGEIQGLLVPCTLFSFSPHENSGRANVADWIRTAYHDMATYNVEDGTGGLDGSIRFPEEQARHENAGSGFDNTIQVLDFHANRYVSTFHHFTGVLKEVSGGPEIAFRGGRIDAGEPNNPGVPEPTQDINSHIASFARQVFTKTEMIGLVACGHSFGGVQHQQFPNISPELNDPNNTLSVAHFDTTFVQFDNNVLGNATEYIHGTTLNPLVVGLNDTANSDKRIFSSDGNATMRAFADSPELFALTCADMFARMLDTVPRGVELTEVITPVPIKPANVQLVLAKDKLKFSGQVRLRNMPVDPTRQVRLLWDDHTNGTHNATLPAVGRSTAINGRYTSAWYGFQPTPEDDEEEKFLFLDAAEGIKSMRFVVNDKLEDQGGVGFAVEDGVVFSATSCVTARSAEGSPLSGRFDIGVRNGLNPTQVYIQREATDTVGRHVVLETEVPAPASIRSWSHDAPTYTIWSIPIHDNVNAYNIGADVEGGSNKLVLPDKHHILDFEDCSE